MNGTSHIFKDFQHRVNSLHSQKNYQGLFCGNSLNA